MLKNALWALAGLVAGFALALVGVIGVEAFSALVHPLPGDFDGSMEQMCLHVARYPAWVLAVVVPMWACAAIAGTWTALWIGNRAAFGAVGLILLVALVYNLSELPYPAWFKAANLIVIPAAILLPLRFSRPRTLQVGKR